MALTDTFVKQIKPKGGITGERYADGGGLYLLVKDSGKYWRLAYRFNAKQKTLALGVYPEVTLAKARLKRAKAREQLADGIDPGLAKKAEKQISHLAAANTFEAVAREYLETKGDAWTPAYSEKWLRGLTKDVFPYIGSLPIATITAPMLLNTLRRVENRGTIDAAHTLRQTTGR